MARRKLPQLHSPLLTAICLVLAFLTDTAHSSSCMECAELYYSFPESSPTFCSDRQEVLSCLQSLNCGSDFIYSNFIQIINDELEQHDCVSSSPTPTPTTAPRDPCLECSDIYLSGSSDRCSVLQESSQCFQEYDCSSLAYIAFQDAIESELAALNCPPCPSIPIADANSVQSLGVANVFPTSHQPSCQPRTIYSLEHCSAFTFSHIRPFKLLTDTDIGTCSLPGAWYLIKHSGFAVEVEGEVQGGGEGVGPSPTRLSKVRVYFFRGQCIQQDLTYSADSSAPFPQTFDQGLSEESNIQLSVSSDGSTVVILSTWLNTSIIIRQFSGYLTVTLQVPGAVALESQGLCSSGCPAHTTVSRDNVTSAVRCISDSNNAKINCFQYSGVANQISEAFYLDTCVFDILVSKNLALLTMTNSTARDSLLLPNVAVRDLASAASPTQLTTTASTTTQDVRPTTTENQPASRPLLEEGSHSSALLSLQPLWLLLLALITSLGLR